MAYLLNTNHCFFLIARDLRLATAIATAATNPMLSRRSLCGLGGSVVSGLFRMVNTQGNAFTTEKREGTEASP